MSTDNFFRDLDPNEVEGFKQWAIEHYKAGAAISACWHPVIRAECAKINEESEMVERAGTGGYESPLENMIREGKEIDIEGEIDLTVVPTIEDDTDRFDSEQEARKAASKPVLELPCTSYNDHQKYIDDLSRFYLKQMDIASPEHEARMLTLLDRMYHDGFEAREFVV
jgi:hypothetical protein